MEALLVRVDERLLHGQVTLGWASKLQPQLLVLASDRIAEDPAQKRLYTTAADDEVAVRVEDVEATAAFLQENPDMARQALVVVETVADARALRQCGAPVEHVNLGGLYEATGRWRLVDYVWLSARDVDTLTQLLQDGVQVEARDLPGTPPVAVDAAVLAQLRDTQ